MGLGTGQNPYWRPDASYGASQAWRQSPFVKDFLDPQIPEGVYNAFIGERGMGGTDALSQWAQGQYGKTLTGYKSAMRANPNLSYRDYLGKQLSGNTMRDQWLGQTAQARGERPTAYQGNTRTITWG